jgi:hypothetical protein
MNIFSKIVFARFAIAVTLAVSFKIVIFETSLSDILLLLIWVPLLQAPSFFFWLACFFALIRLLGKLRRYENQNESILSSAAIAELLTLTLFTFINIVLTFQPAIGQSDVSVNSGVGPLVANGAYTRLGLILAVDVFKEIYATLATISLASVAFALLVSIRAARFQK